LPPHATTPINKTVTLITERMFMVDLR